LVAWSKLVYYLKMIRVYLLIAFCLLSNCNTVTGTVEGTAIGVYKDIKTFHHYSTCVFTKTQCGDLNLD